MREVEGWRMYDDGEKDWIRAIDLAERAEMSRPRDIKVVVRGLVEDGAASVDGSGAAAFSSGISGAGAARATNTKGAVVRAEKVLVVNGNRGGTQETVELYLNQEAACLVAMRLRTPKAVEIQCQIAHVFVAAMKGRLSPVAAPVAQGLSATELGTILKAQAEVYQTGFERALEMIERNVAALLGALATRSVASAPKAPQERAPSPGSDQSKANAET